MDADGDGSQCGRNPGSNVQAGKAVASIGTWLVQKAIKAARKLGSVTLVGFDASTEELAAILAGEQAASVAQFPAKMGSLGIETAVAAARGQVVPASIDTGTEMATRDNAASFRVQPSASPSEWLSSA